MPDFRSRTSRRVPGRGVLLRSTFALALLGAVLQAQVAPDYPFRAADDSASPRIATLRADIAARRRGAVDRFWADVRRAGTPLVEPSPASSRQSLVTFVWRGSKATRNVVVADGVAAGAGGIDPANSQMIRMPGTDVWYRTYEVRNDARFTYMLSENDSMRSFIDPSRVSKSVKDPLNPRVYRTGHSFLELADAPPQVGLTASPAGGTVTPTRFTSQRSGTDRAVWVYTPPGFRAERRDYPLVVVLDGGAYTTLVPVPSILDVLIAGGHIPPAVAVMVDTGFNRVRELSCSAPFSEFLAQELVPWMRADFGAGVAAETTIVAGSSLGGLASACAAAAHRNVFGAGLSQSGSFWWKPEGDAAPEWLTRHLAGGGQLPARLFLEVGAMEVPEQLETNRRLRDALRARGANVVYREFNGNHTYLNWRGGFADGLVALLSGAR